MPLVSVIIPNYNHASYVKDRIESVMNQTFQNFELIILDDCSTDNSREIIDNYKKHKKVSHIIFNESNSGSTFKQWKKGIELAKGEYIWIAESDDVADKFFLEETMKLFNESIGIVYSQSKSIDQNGLIGDSWISHTQDLEDNLWLNNFSFNGKEFVKKFMLFKNVIPNASAVVFKKELYDKVGGLNTKYTLNGDWDFYSRILRITNIAFVHKSLNYFRQHSNKGSLTNIQNGNNLKEYYWLEKKWISDFELSNMEKKKLNYHIYAIWHRQFENKRFKIFSKSFFNIFPAAFSVDKRIFTKMISK